MKPPKADLVLHPVRLRVIQALVGRELTTADIARELPDVPPASLYRHLRRLADGGVVAVAAERRVRGATQRTYTVAPGAALIGRADLAGLTRADHMRLFAAFVGAVLAGFQRYLDRGEPDLLTDGVVYRQMPLYLDGAEYEALVAGVGELIDGAMAHEPGPGRRAFRLTTILIPEPGPPEARAGGGGSR